jgi:hypothetical protein
MVELDSYSIVDWSDSAVNHDKAKALKSNSLKAKLCLQDLPIGFRFDFCLSFLSVPPQFRFCTLRSLQQYGTEQGTSQETERWRKEQVNLYEPFICALKELPSGYHRHRPP